MSNLLTGAALFVLVLMVLGLARILWGPTGADRILAVQLAGTGGTAILLLLAVANRAAAVVDVALILALLAAFMSVAFVRGAASVGPAAPDEPS